MALSGSGSDVSAADEALLTYSWELNNDGVFEEAKGASPSVSWSVLEALGLNNDGGYTVTVRVSDDDTYTDATAAMTMLNVAP